MANLFKRINTMSICNEDTWKVIESYFKNKHLHQLVKHQVESYNDFIQNQMKKTIEMFNPLDHSFFTRLYQRIRKISSSTYYTF